MQGQFSNLSEAGRQDVGGKKYIVNYNTFPYTYFHHIQLLYNLYIYLRNFKYFYSTINCNTVPYSYSSHFLSLHILYI